MDTQESAASKGNFALPPRFKDAATQKPSVDKPAYIEAGKLARETIARQERGIIFVRSHDLQHG